MRSNQQVLEEANPSKIDGSFNNIGLGSAFGNIARHTRGTVATNVLTLPDAAKAVALITVFATVGTSAGAKTPVSGAPSAGEVSISADGNVVFNATDAVTAAEVVYLSAEGAVVEAQVPVADDGSTQLPNSRSAIVLISASLDDDADSAGPKTVVARAASAASAGEAKLNLAGQFVFNTTDVGSDPVTATVKYIEYPAETVSDALQADSNQ